MKYWIATTFCTDIHNPQRVHLSNINDPLRNPLRHLLTLTLLTNIDKCTSKLVMRNNYYRIILVLSQKGVNSNHYFVLKHYCYLWKVTDCTHVNQSLSFEIRYLKLSI